MGCGSSREAGHEGTEMRHQVSAPTGGPVMVPPPYRDQSGRPIQHQSSDLSRETLFTALNNMAASLERQQVTAHAVSVGGAVNTLYLQSRQSTHDVDFFLASPSAAENNAIHQAARHANRQVRGALGGEWFNNSTQLFMGPGVQQLLASEAFEQNAVIFDRTSQRGGLKIYAAPWSYALCGKLNRLCDPSRRPYDLPDAVVYLHQYLQRHRRQSVRAETIRKWCRQYAKNVTDAVLREIDEAYRRKYGHRAISF